MPSVNLYDAKVRLEEIIAGLIPGEEIMIVKKGEPIANLTRSPRNQRPCKASSEKDTKHWMAPDFNCQLEDF
jgi:antitoxin (DNA-binding transcriptional repressor) of toxin-antitoxin stability system